MSRLAARAMLAALIGSLGDTKAETKRRESVEDRFDAFAADYPLPVQRVRTPEEIAARKSRKAAKKKAKRGGK